MRSTWGRQLVDQFRSAPVELNTHANLRRMNSGSPGSRAPMWRRSLSSISRPRSPLADLLADHPLLSVWQFKGPGLPTKSVALNSAIVSGNHCRCGIPFAWPETGRLNRGGHRGFAGYLGALMQDFIMPIIALIGGVASLWIDPKDLKKRWLLIFGLVFTAVLTIIFNHSNSKAKELQLDRVNAEKAQTRQILLNITQNVQAVVDKIDVLTSMGFTENKAAAASDEQISSAIQANELYSSSLSRQSGVALQDIQVRYSPENVNADRVIGSINNSGMHVVVQPSVNARATNCIWAGDKVTPAQVKIVAYALMRAGVAVKAIRRFKDGTGDKQRIIEVGAAPDLVNKQALSPDQIAAKPGIDPPVSNPS